MLPQMTDSFGGEQDRRGIIRKHPIVESFMEPASGLYGHKPS